MTLNRLFFLLVCPILLISCIKAEALDWELELPKEVFVLPDSSVATLRMAIIGDSISSFKGSSPSDLNGYEGASYQYYYPKGDVRRIECMWWYKVARVLEIPLENICNCSWSGSRVTGNSTSTTSASAGCSTKRVIDLSSKGFDPDIVLCFISCNDWAGNVSLGNWSYTEEIPMDGLISTTREAYALMIAKIREQYPSCLVFCMTNLEDTKRDYTPGWPSNNRKGVSVNDWNASLTELFTSLGCFTIDLQDCGINYDNLPNYTIDGGLHPNNAGMTLIANKVVTELIKRFELTQDAN